MIDGAVLHLPTAVQSVAASKGKWRIISPSIARQGLGIAVDPAQPKLLEQVTAAARSLEKAGEVARIESLTFELTYQQASAAGAGG
jgi:ABC-type amino acid transport substrate-binding protein